MGNFTFYETKKKEQINLNKIEKSTNLKSTLEQHTGTECKAKKIVTKIGYTEREREREKERERERERVSKKKKSASR